MIRCFSAVRVGRCPAAVSALALSMFLVCSLAAAAAATPAQAPVTTSAASTTASTTAAPAISDPAKEARLKSLAEELRCLVCQNQTLADSQAELAVDLRNQVKAMIDQDQSDAQIKRYLVDRYGDFVLYKPPMQGNTWALWAGPFALLLLGLLIWWQLGRRGKTPAMVSSNETAPTRAKNEAGHKLLDDR